MPRRSSLPPLPPLPPPLLLVAALLVALLAAAAQPSAALLERPRATVVWYGHIATVRSLAAVNREIAKRLNRLADVDVFVVPREVGRYPEEPSIRSADEALTALLRERVLSVIEEPPCIEASVHVFHEYPINWTRPACGRWVVMVPWEADVLLAEWLPHLFADTAPDEIWVYSRPIAQAFLDAGFPAHRVAVITLGVDLDIFARVDRTAPSLPADLQGLVRLDVADDAFRFLFVGGAIGRKGFDTLVRAYAEEFRADTDRVVLVIKDMGSESFYKNMHGLHLLEKRLSHENAPPFLLLREPLDELSLASLYAQCHVLVHPYRAEGFGLTIAEALATGMPVIVTAGGSTDDFCSDDFAWRIPSARFALRDEATFQDRPATGVPHMLEPDRAALRQLMRALYERYAEALPIAQGGRAYARTHLGWESSAALVRDRVRALLRIG